MAIATEGKMSRIHEQQHFSNTTDEVICCVKRCFTYPVTRIYQRTTVPSTEGTCI